MQSKQQLRNLIFAHHLARGTVALAIATVSALTVILTQSAQAQTLHSDCIPSPEEQDGAWSLCRS